MKAVIATHFKTEELALKEAKSRNKKRGKRVYVVVGEKERWIVVSISALL